MYDSSTHTVTTHPFFQAYASTLLQHLPIFPTSRPREATQKPHPISVSRSCLLSPSPTPFIAFKSMTTGFFVTPCPVTIRGSRPQLSPRRPCPVVWAVPSMTGSAGSNPGSEQPSKSSSGETDSPSGPLGDPQWAELAQQITPPVSGSEPTADPLPKWTYPDGDPRDVGTDNPWKLWENAVEKEKSLRLTPRDVKAETDFWRGAARDLKSDATSQSAGLQNNSDAAGSSESQLKSNPFTVRSESTGNETPVPPKQSPFNVSPPAQPALSSSKEVTGGPFSNEQAPPLSSSTDIWREARGVTAKMSSMQSELRQELDRYNPFESTDEYRQMARDLVGPANDEPWEDKDPVPVSDQSEVGSGWNPDVDWMRYDDVGREKALKDPLIQQRVAEEAARQPKRDTFSSDITSEDTSNPAGYGPPDASDNTVEWATYTDQRPSSSDSTLSATGGNQLPGFLRNRMMSGSMYGSGRTDMQNDIEDLRRRGIELRNPKSDADAWRGIAKELKLDPESSSGSETTPPSAESGAKNAGEPPIEEISEGDMVGEDAAPTESESVSWSRWQSSRDKWDRANKNLKPRDPREEVDAWRMSAKELLSGVDIPVEQNDAHGGTSGTNEESSAWSKWRESDDKWRDQVLQNEKDWNNGNSFNTGSVDSSEVKEPQGRVKNDQFVSAWLSFAKEVGQTANDAKPEDSAESSPDNSEENPSESRN